MTGNAVKFFSGLCAAVALGALTIGAAQAEDTIKVGLIATFSGAGFADSAKQMENGAKLYIKEHGDTVAGKKIVLLSRDSTGMAPDVAKRLAQELVVRDKVDFITGFVLTPNALAVADIATKSKTPMIIMNAATSIITTKSPFIARTSFTLPQATMPLGQWAAKNGIKQAYTMVTDYGPGLDAEKYFTKGFTEGGGTIVGSVRLPVQNPDFSPYIQKLKDLKPQAVFVFVPSGEQPVQFMKTFAEQGLDKSGMKVLATGDVTDDSVLQSMGDAPLGMITSHHYSYVHDSALNKQFTKEYAEAYGDYRPDFLAVDAYDGMAVVYKTIEALKGQMDGEKAMEIIKHLSFESPRGPIQIDPDTRDIVQNMYIRKVEKVDGKIVNVEFDTIPMVKDPGK